MGKQISDTKKKILIFLQEPRRWGEIKNMIKLPDSILYRHIKELQEIGWIDKVNKKWVLTEEGEKRLEELELIDLIKRLLEKGISYNVMKTKLLSLEKI